MEPKIGVAEINRLDLEHQRCDKQSLEQILKVPPCDTEDFYGGYAQWPPFRDMFQAVFGNHPRLTNGQKLYHFRSKTKGEAAKIVQRFPLSDCNYELGWQALYDRFEKKRILVTQELKKLFNISNITHKYCNAIRGLQDNVNDSLSILQTYKITTTDWDTILVHLVSSKLPDETLLAWEDSLEYHTEVPKWNE